MKKIERKEFDEYLKLLNESYYSNHNKTEEESYRALNELESFYDRSANKIIMGVFAIVLVLIGALEIYLKGAELSIYFFGFVFLILSFLVVYVADNFDKKGAIVIFTHGGTGLGCMIGFDIAKLLNIPNSLPYIITVVLLGIGGLLSAYLYATVDKYSYSKYFRVLPVILILLCLTLTTIYPFVLK